MAKSVTKYAKTSTQLDTYSNIRNSWKDEHNAENHVNNTYAIGRYSKSKSTYKRPNDFYLFDYEVGIPSDAKIKSIKFQLKIKKTDNLNVKAPVGIFEYWKDTIKDTSSSGLQTGWRSGAYRYAPSQKLSTNWAIIDYTISDSNLKKYKDIVSVLNRQEFGLHLRFHDATSAGNVDIAWCRLIVEYDLPNRYLTMENVSRDSEKPTQIEIDETYTIKLTTGNKSIAKKGNETFHIDLPLGMELISAKAKDSISFDTNTLEWVVSGKANAKSTLTLKVKPKASGFKTLAVFPTLETTSYKGYFFVMSDRVVAYDELIITPAELRRGEKSCISFATLTQTNSTSFNIVADIEGITSNDIISCEFNEEASTDGVTFNSATVANQKVTMSFTIDNNLLHQEVLFYVTLCYYPRVSGDKIIHAVTTNNAEKNEPVTILDSYEKHFLINTDVETGNCTEIIKVDNNRIVSQIEGDLVVLPISTDEYDKDMYIGESTFGLDQWKKVRYIGCVEVPYAHYDPKNTTKDKLLDEHYKNDYYLGKENAVDEDITLKVKVPRKKTPTIIGLIGIDRPIPINLVPTAWEGDPLNHRGWAEIYGVTVDPTNPLYDDLDIDVKYITHNIISRFHIKLGSELNKFKLPDVLNNSLVSGGDIGEFFEVTTDGSYIYDEEDNSTHRNMFTFNNGQDILLRSKDVLSSKSEFSLYWDSIKFSEFRENNISRIIRLVDEKGNAVFEYEHYDFDFTGGAYKCSVIGRVATEDGFNPLINRDVYIHSDVEYTDDETDEDYDDENLDFYGSKTSFELDANVLTVKEDGFSGYEFKQEDIQLPTGSYYLEVYWKNNNSDSDTGNSVAYMDFEINEMEKTSALGKYYNKLVVSPYPVPKKNIIFTRLSEEGLIYYLENDNNDFSFILEPFYQYYCGVDLTAEGFSIFDFNNSYPVIYIQNGLIRFGINRINGDLYLDKWDYQSKEYIRTNRFRITKYDDADVVVINDDIITVQVSDIYITMWRGRPYVMLQHEKEDIEMLDTFNQVYADGVGDTPYEYPQIINLFNSSNLLPECVGGTNLIKSSCIEVEVDDTELEDIGDFIIIPNKTECYQYEDVVCKVHGDFEDGDVALVVNGDVVGTNVGNTIDATMDTLGENVIYAVFMGNDTYDMEISNVVAVNVVDGSGWLLKATNANKFKYNQGSLDYILTYNGAGYGNITVEVPTPAQVWTVLTRIDGTFEIPINFQAGTYNIVAKAWDNGEVLTVCKRKVTISKSTPVLKGTTLTVNKGKKATFRIVDESNNPISDATIDINIGGTKYVRTSHDNGYFTVKMSKTGTYQAKLKYAGEKKKYNAVSKKFTIEVK